MLSTFPVGTGTVVPGRPLRLQAMPLNSAFDDELNRLARLLSENDHIASPTLWRILADIDGEIDALVRAGVPVPRRVRDLREISARACLLREEAERRSQDG